MKLVIKSFADAGNLEKERIVLRALEDVDVGDFLVIRSKKSQSGGPLSGSKDAYWLPNVTVKAGDLVVIYTRKGSAAKKSLNGGRTAHFYYWHKIKPFWRDSDNNVAVLMEAGDWRSEAP